MQAEEKEMKTKTSKQFYTETGPDWLAKRKKSVQTKLEISYLKEKLNKNQKILDVACGYGRLAVPLAKQGYDIQGIDITPALIKRARETAKKEKLNINFKVGSMTHLSYKNNYLGAIICMWSAFNEIYKEKDQIKAIKEFSSVLVPKGIAIIDMPMPFDPKEMSSDDFRFVKENIILGKIDGIDIMPSYNHSKETLRKLMKKTKVKKFKILIENYGGRNRLQLRICK